MILLKMFSVGKKMQYKIFIRDKTESKNNVRNKVIILTKMYERNKLLKCVLGKIPNSLFFTSNKKSSYSTFYLSIPPNILQIFIFLKFLHFYIGLSLIKILFTTDQRKKVADLKQVKNKSWSGWDNIHCDTKW